MKMHIPFWRMSRESISRINRVAGTIPEEHPAAAIYRKMLHTAMSRDLKITSHPVNTERLKKDAHQTLYYNNSCITILFARDSLLFLKTHQIQTVNS